MAVFRYATVTFQTTKNNGSKPYFLKFEMYLYTDKFTIYLVISMH